MFWHFLKVLHTLETLPTKLLAKRFLSITSAHKSITQSMTQTSLEDAYKLKSLFSLQDLLKRMRSWTWGWKDVYKMTNTFHTQVILQGRTKKCYFMTQGLTYKSWGWGDPGRVGFWVFTCTDLDSVQKFLDWHLEYFFLSTNVCWNNIWTLEIILSPDSGLAQIST